MLCPSDRCPNGILTSNCVFYTGPILYNLGYSTNISLDEAFRILDSLIPSLGGGGGGGGTITGGINIGSGEGIYKSVSGNLLVFKSILGTGLASVSSTLNEVVVNVSTPSLQQVLSQSNDAGGLSIQNLGAPSLPSDAARLQDIPSTLPPSGPAGGDLTGTYPNPTLIDTGVTPGTYGSVSQYPRITVDSKGRITSASSISLPSSLPPSGPAGGDLTGTYPNPSLIDTGVTPGTYGNASQYPQITVDSKGRIISVSNITLPAGGALKVRAVALSNITLSGLQTVDGVSLSSGDLVLVNGQSTASDNGVYVVSTGSWTRSTEADTANELNGLIVLVLEGSTKADTLWIQTADNITLGTTSISFTEVLPDSTETVKGKVQLATQTQATDAGNATSSGGANHTAAATPRGMWWFFEARRLLSLFYRWIFEYVDIAGTTYQPVLSDGGKIIRYSSSSAVTVTIPNDSTVDFPIGTRIRHRRTGTGIVTLSPASGVSFITPDATNLSIRKIYGYIDTIKTAANTWQLDHSPSSSWEFFKTQPATITAAWEIVGTDDSNATYCFVLKNLSGNIIARFRNDQVFEVGGTSHFIKVPAGIPSGNSKFEFLNNQLLAYIFGTSSNNFLEFQSTTGDLRVRFKVRRELEQSGAQLFEFNVETSVTATSGGVTTIGSFPMAAGYVANVELSWVATANDGNCAGGVVNHTIRNVGGTTSAVGSQNSFVRSTLTSAPSLNIVANDTSDSVDFSFTNGVTPDHRAYKVNIFAKILYTNIAV